MLNKVNQLDFEKQPFFIGLDVHKKSWTVTIRSNNMHLKTFSMNPSAPELSCFMKKHYPGGLYKTVYEAGYCGFWIHKQLEELGFNSIVINPADVPTTHKEKSNKRDKVDSRKLSRELENGSLQGIYIPDEFHQQLRTLCRLRYRINQNQTRVKNRIKGLLSFYGISLPPKREMGHWSKAFIVWLQSLEFSYPLGKESLRFYIEELLEHRKRLAEVIRMLRKNINQYELSQLISYMRSVPGIGFVTASTMYCELIDINRFYSLDRLASFVGLVPSVTASSDQEYDHGLTFRYNRHLRYLLVEAAWTAIRTDPVLTHKFSQLTRRMTKQEKLLNRVRYVWKHQQRYVIGVIE
ncbi:MAG: IS110 family RNA-guided transposase [Planctomycetota bacterium]|jgi:transposase